MIKLSKARAIVEMPETAEVLRKYMYIFGTLYNTDASDDYTFQTAFCDFYSLLKDYPESYKTKFFKHVEELKESSDVIFLDAIQNLHKIDNRYDMAAASILISCVNPRYPVWNKAIVGKYFGIVEPPAEEASAEKCSKLYEEFMDKLYVYMNSPEGKELIKVFDTKFPSAEITNVNKVAILIWQDQLCGN